MKKKKEKTIKEKKSIKKKKSKMKEDYKIIIMDYDGEPIYEYYSCVVPMAGDSILIEDEKSFTVQTRHFSTNHNRVVLLGEMETGVEEIKNN